MKLGKKAAIKDLKVGKCMVCESVKPVHVVVTIRDDKGNSLQIPCCSNECACILAVVLMED